MFYKYTATSPRGYKTKVITMFMNLGPLAKGQHGVKRRSPQVVGRSQKEDMSSSLDIVLRRSQQG